MTLDDCTKDELKWVINQLITKYFFQNGKYRLKSVLNELEWRRVEAKLEEAEHYAQIAHDKRAEYCDLVRKYEGVPLLKIPNGVLARCMQLLKEAEEADAKWEKLSGIRTEV